MEFYLDTTIVELKEAGIISVRTFNSLHYARMETLGCIVNKIKAPNDLLKLRNFGFKSLTEIEPILRQMVRDSSTNLLRTKGERPMGVDERLNDIIAEAYKMVTEGDSNVKRYLQFKYPYPNDLNNLIMGDLDDVLAIVDGYSREENLEIRHTFKQYIELVLEKLESSHDVGNMVYAKYNETRLHLSYKMEYFSAEQIIEHFLSPTIYEYLEERYQTLVSTQLSVRTRHFIAKYLPHFPDIIKYSDEDLVSYRKICPGTHQSKTLSEIFQFNQKFKQEFNTVSKLTEEELHIEHLKFDYPYLTSNQRKFVCDFIKEEHRAPMFYLLLNYLRLSESRSNVIYCLTYGIFDGKYRTLHEVASATNLSRERVRQIVKGKIEVQKSSLVKNEEWSHYKNIFNLPLIYEKTEDFIRLKEMEHLAINFKTFASLIKLVVDFKIEEVNGHTILINNKYDNINISECIEKFCSIRDAKYSSDTYVPLSSILSSIPETYRPDVRELMSYIIEDSSKVQITENDQLYLPQNYIDVAEELYSILDRKGEPMHVEEIFCTFKKKYPEHKYTDFSQIKPFLLKHKNIKPIGKTSCYALDSWEGIYFGSIRDLLVDLLRASDTPLHIDKLYDGVKKYYPNTNKASLKSTMEDENLQRFVEFEGSYFGLTEKKYSPSYVQASTYQRYSFEERISRFKEFVDTYHRFPSFNGSENEASLMRWCYNVINNVLTVTNSQRNLFDDMIKHYDELGYPRSATENDFLIKCQDLKKFIRQYHTLPTSSNAPELYAWLHRSRDNYDSYTDKRRLYMTDLLYYILSFGFSI